MLLNDFLLFATLMTLGIYDAACNISKVSPREWRFNVYEYEYFFQNKPFMTWTQAKLACETNYEAALPVFTDLEEIALVRQYLDEIYSVAYMSRMWIGFIQGDTVCDCGYNWPLTCEQCLRTWVWYDGTPFMDWQALPVVQHQLTTLPEMQCGMLYYRDNSYNYEGKLKITATSCESSGDSRGIICKKVPDRVTCQFNRCKNNAVCENTDSLYRCNCLPGFVGRLCEIVESSKQESTETEIKQAHSWVFCLIVPVLLITNALLIGVFCTSRNMKDRNVALSK